MSTSSAVYGDTHYAYLLGCKGADRVYVKIGVSSSLKRRISNIQTSCPHPVTHAFLVKSPYREETEGLEKLLHMLLEPERLRGEWYEGSRAFFKKLDAVLRRINSGGFSYEELLDMPDFVGPEFEVMMHRHSFEFLQAELPLRNGVDPIETARQSSPEEIAKLLLADLPKPSVKQLLAARRGSARKILL